MALKIERDNEKIKVVFVGQRYSISVPMNQLLNVIAHYYVLPEHKSAECQVCKDVNKRK